MKKGVEIVHGIIRTARRGVTWVTAYKQEHPALMSVLSLTSLILVPGAAVLFFYPQLAEAFRLAFGIGWAVGMLPLLFLLWNGIAALGWQRVIRVASRETVPGLAQLTSIRIQAQALNMVMPLSGVGGEVLRSAKLGGVVGLHRSVRIISLEKAVDLFSEIMAGMLGVAAFIGPYTGLSISRAAAVTAATLFAAPLLFWNFLWRRLFSGWPFAKGKERLARLAHDRRLCRASKEAYYCHLAERLLIIAEIYVIARLLGTALSVHQLLVLNSMSSIATLLFMVVPGRIGSFECSLALGFSLLGLPESTGLSVAIIKRARQILFCFTGLTLLFVNKRQLPRRGGSIVPHHTRTPESSAA